MKVLLVNGSPNKLGATNEVLLHMKKYLNDNEVESEIFWIGNKAISGCLGCGKCFKNKQCILDDSVNTFLSKVISFDAFIFATPVHFAGPSGLIDSFMDRVFYGKGSLFKGKPAASITICRRAGGLSTFDRMNKYFSYACMPIVSSNYWNGVFASNKEDVAKDEEGLQTMKVLSNNMAWLLKCIEAGKKEGIMYPEMEKKILTSFWR